MMTKFSELTQEQRTEVIKMGYQSMFKEIVAEEVPALMEKLAQAKDTNGLVVLMMQHQNLFILELWAQKQRNAELIGVIGEAYQWVEKAHKERDFEPEDCIITLYETLKESDQAEKWLEGTELITDEDGVWTWKIE